MLNLQTFSTTFGQHSLLMILIFIAAICSLFATIILFDIQAKTWYKLVNVAIFVAIFCSLVYLRADFVNNVNTILERRHFPLSLEIIIITLVAVFVFQMYGLIRIYESKKTEISRNSIKEAIDSLPVGMCYFNCCGQMILSNLQMDRILKMLSGEEINTVDEIENILNGDIQSIGISCISRELKGYRFPDENVWKYTKSTLIDSKGECYTEIIFSDVTDLYEAEKELRSQRETLEDIANNIKSLNKNILALSKEREVLAAKTKLHSQMGAALTSIRQSLSSDDLYEREDAVKLLYHAINSIKDYSVLPDEKKLLSKIVQDANAIGVELNINGNMPDDERIINIYVIAMRECLLNAVLHAKAEEMWIDMGEAETSYRISITNDGILPDGEVVARGGLLNLQRNVLELGGGMVIHSEPIFELEIWIPRSEED